MAREIPIRAARVGDLVQSKEDQETRLVRKVEVVLTLENGVQEIYDAGDTVVWMPQEPLPDIGAVQEELDREIIDPYLPDDLEVPESSPKVEKPKKDPLASKVKKKKEDA